MHQILVEFLDKWVWPTAPGLRPTRPVRDPLDVVSTIGDGSLKTNAGWWEMHGGSIKGFIEYLSSHPLFVFVAGGASIGGLMIVLYSKVWPSMVTFGEHLLKGAQK